MQNIPDEREKEGAQSPNHELHLFKQDPTCQRYHMPRATMTVDTLIAQRTRNALGIDIDSRLSCVSACCYPCLLYVFRVCAHRL
jgi:hypothetical protein